MSTRQPQDHVHGDSGASLLLRPAVWVMNRLAYPRKFVLIGAIFLIPFLFMTWLQLTDAQRLYSRYTDETRGMAALQPMVKLLKLIQFHGVFSSAIEAGDLRYEERLRMLKDELAASYEEAENDIIRLKNLTEARALWQEIGADWRRVSGRETLNAQETMDLHNRIYGNMNSLILLVADHYRLTHDPNREMYYLMHAYTDLLPKLTYQITSSSMLLAHMSERRTILPEDRYTVGAIKLACRDLLEQLIEVDMHLAYTFSGDADLEKTLQNYQNATKQQAETYLNFLDQNVVHAADVSFDPVDVSDLSEDLNSTVFSFFERIGPQLASRVDERMRFYRQRMELAYALVGGTTLVLIYAFWGFSRAVNGSIKQLRNATKRMIDGTDEIFHIDARDELAQVAGSYNEINSVLQESRQLRLKVEEQREAAESANRAKSEFLATMSHEIRTPMNAVIGMTGLLFDTQLTERQRDYLETIHSSGEALLTLINDILDFSKIEAGKLELCSEVFALRDTIETALDLIQVRASQKGLELACWIDPQVPAHVAGDPLRLRQILLNLLSNAVKFTEHGVITVEVYSEPVQVEDTRAGGPTGVLPALPPMAELHFIIRDTGIGIPAERMGRLFRIFSQVDSSTTRSYGGSGLGLAISRRLAEMMGGRMWAESIENAGSTFHFTMLTTPVVEREPVFDPSDAALLRGRHVLVVEPNETVRDFLKRQLESWGMQVNAASGGEDAGALTRAQARIELIVLDRNLPGGGLALGRTLRRAHGRPSLPLVILDPRRGANEREQLEAMVHVNKPVKPRGLHHVLAGLLAGRSTVEPVSSARNDTRRKTAFLYDATLGVRQPLAILLAEDNSVNQKLAVSVLAKFGYYADVANNGEEAVEAALARNYDLVFMDVHMPKMDGLQATREIRARIPRPGGPRIVAMTANVVDGARTECLAAGMDDYISKPFRIEDLRAVLEKTASARNSDFATPTRERESRQDPPLRFERRALERLAEMTDPEFVAQAIQEFLKGMPGRLSEMSEAWRAGNTEDLYRYAHTLKSNCAQFGLHAFAAALDEIEAGSAREVPDDGMERRVERLALLFADLKPELEESLSSWKNMPKS